MKEEAERIAAEALKRAAKVLGPTDLKIIIEEDKGQAIPETGIGGSTPDSHTIFVYLDPENLNLQQNLEREVRSTVTHEYHHAVRNRSIDWQTDTLLGAMITEGLADHFDLEVNGGEPRPWSIALLDDQLEESERKTEPFYENRNFDWGLWFFGSQPDQVPRWAGYALGFKLVGDYLTKTGEKASALVSAPAERFI